MDSFKKFISNLKRYKKKDVVRVSLKLMWDGLKNNAPRDDTRVLIESYSPILMLLSLATSNNLNKSLSCNKYKIIQLSKQYINITETIADKQFLDEECLSIINSIQKNNSDKKSNKLPIYENIIKKMPQEFFLSRLLHQQNLTHLWSINEYYVTFEIFNQLNNKLCGELDTLFRSYFNTDFLNFMRSAFCLWTIASFNSGKIFLKTITLDNFVKHSLNVNIDILSSVAEKISYKESLLKNWYDAKVLSQPNFYQKYHNNILKKYPVVKMDKTSGMDYIIPNPKLFLRAIRETIFSNIIKPGRISSELGNVMEEYIYTILKYLFGDTNVIRIPKTTTPTADFKILIENCILIVECKLSLATKQEKLSTMSPEGVAKIWDVLYRACKQCSASMLESKVENKIIIPIILCADNLTSENLSFYSYAHKSMILKSLDIEHIEILSWNEFQYCLSKTSIKKFINKLIERKNNHYLTLGQIAAFSLEIDEPAHAYEYLKDAERAIHLKEIPR